MQQLRTDNITTEDKIRTCRQCIRYASSQNRKEEEIDIRLSLAEALFDSGNYLESIKELNHIRSVIETSIQSHRPDSVIRRLHIRLLFDLNRSNIFVSNYSEAMNNILYILNHYVTDSIKDIGIMAQCYNNIGAIFMAKEQNATALEYYTRSQALFRKQKNLYGEGMLHGNIGNVYNSIGNSSLALKHYLEHYNILAQIGKEDNLLTHSILNLGLAYQGLQSYRIADKYFNEAIRLIEKHEYNHLKGFAFYNLAVNEKYSGNYQEAEKHAKTGIEAVRSNQKSRIYVELLKLLGDIEEHKGNYREANLYLKQSYALQDSINKGETEEKIALLAYQFDNYREKQMLILQQHELELANKKLTNRNLWIACFGFGIFIAIIAISYLHKKSMKQYRISRQTENKLNSIRNELDTQIRHVKKDTEKEIESKNKELLAISLRMNKIQEALDAIKQNLALLKIAPPLRNSERKLLKEIETAVTEIGSESHWNEFDLYYCQVEQDFIHQLDKNYPRLTPNEKRLCAFIHLNFSTKEIANITNRSPQSVDTAKSRLKKKIGLNTDENLYEVMARL